MTSMARRGRNSGLLSAHAAICGDLVSMTESTFGTMAWKPHFRAAIKGYSRITVSSAPRSKRDGNCEACGRGSHSISHKLQLSGIHYDSFSFLNSARWDKFSTATRGSSAPARATFYVGNTCGLKSYLFHAGLHFKLRMYEKVKTRLDASDNLASFLRLSPANVQWRNVHFRRFKTCLKSAQNFSNQSGRGVNWDLWSDEGGDEGGDAEAEGSSGGSQEDVPESEDGEQGGSSQNSDSDFD